MCAPYHPLVNPQQSDQYSPQQYAYAMHSSCSSRGNLFAVSDLHIAHPENRLVVENLRPQSEIDWLLVCGDISESLEDVEWALSLLGKRFAEVIWVPGNHELWTSPSDILQLRGDERYRHIVSWCRNHGIVTPEDPYLIWSGPGGPVVVAPMFILYDYSFGVNMASTKEESLALAHEAGVVCTDEFLLYPDPYTSREHWCRERVKLTEQRLASLSANGLPSILVNHFPLLAELTRPLFHPEFAQWCGTTLTADWHRRFRASVVVYGHLHIPRTTWHDGVRFEEVSLGYPRERRFRKPTNVLRRILPSAA
jgi:predicted phosphodiesterase